MLLSNAATAGRQGPGSSNIPPGYPALEKVNLYQTDVGKCHNNIFLYGNIPAAELTFH